MGKVTKNSLAKNSPPATNFTSNNSSKKTPSSKDKTNNCSIKSAHPNKTITQTSLPITIPPFLKKRKSIRPSSPRSTAPLRASVPYASLRHLCVLCDIYPTPPLNPQDFLNLALCFYPSSRIQQRQKLF